MVAVLEGAAGKYFNVFPPPPLHHLAQARAHSWFEPYFD